VRHYLDQLGDHAPHSPPPRYEDLLRQAVAGDGCAGATLERQARYLGMGLAALRTGLSPEVIVVFGEITGAWGRIGPIVEDVVARWSLPGTPTRIVATDPQERPRLRGAVTLVVQQHFGAPNVA